MAPTSFIWVEWSHPKIKARHYAPLLGVARGFHRESWMESISPRVLLSGVSGVATSSSIILSSDCHLLALYVCTMSPPSYCSGDYWHLVTFSVFNFFEVEIEKCIRLSFEACSGYVFPRVVQPCRFALWWGFWFMNGRSGIPMVWNWEWLWIIGDIDTY